MDGRIAIDDGLFDLAQLAFAAGPGNVCRGQIGIGVQGHVAVGHRAFVIAHIQVDRGPLHAGLRLARIELDGPLEILEGLFQELGGLVGPDVRLALAREW